MGKGKGKVFEKGQQQKETEKTKETRAIRRKCRPAGDTCVGIPRVESKATSEGDRLEQFDGFEEDARGGSREEAVLSRSC